MRRMLRLVPLFALALPLVACGNDDTGSDANGPVKIMSIASFESSTYSIPQLKTAIQASVDAVNEDGGIDGRDLEVLFCNDKFDPNEATACAQRAVSEKVVAVVGGMTPHTAAIAPVLEAAKIPFIGPGGGDGVAESEQPAFYPINAGSTAFVIGAGRLAVERGGPNVVVVPMDVGSSLASVDNAKLGIEGAGGKMTQVVAPATAADYNPTALKVLDQDPDGVVLTASGDTATRIVGALRDNGFTGPITGPASIVNPASIKALGDKAEGIVLAGRGLPASYTENEMIQKFNDEVHGIDADAPIDDISLNGWLAVRLTAAAFAGHDITDGQSAIAALADIKEPIDLFGIYPAYPGLGGGVPHDEYPRVAVFEVQPSTIEGGHVVPDGEFFDPLEG
ncbi:ABC transporter substrate-binding protein [Nocardioides humi]|uniref:Leucine-binding protein domain-containing protein n=1 Tax=Nocardioides humi TaxID=449461 RepID=A0ABN2AGF8_9ACTN|nr:ABC transporter substrate-binding protein [Nocardioides humi]